MSKTLVYYPGHHGPEALVRLSANRMMRFKASKVREVSQDAARSLVRLSGYFEAMRLEQVAEKYGVDAKALAEKHGVSAEEFAASMAVRTAVYEDETVIVLDTPTARFLRARKAGEASPEATTASSGDAAVDISAVNSGVTAADNPSEQAKSVKKGRRNKK